MGDANKIKKIVSDSSKEYLSKSLATIEAASKPYNLDHEFAKTRLNRSLFVIAVTLVTVAAFALAALFVTKAIENSTERQAVDVSSFEDLNLKDLLDVAKRSEETHDRLNRELGDLERALEAELRAAKTAYDDEQGLIAATRLSASARKTRVDQSARSYAATVAAIHKRYDPLIAAKRAELDDASRSLAAYDSRMLEQAKKNEEELASERRVFEVEREELKAYYEDRLSGLEREAASERERFERSREELVATLEAAKAEELAETVALYNPLFDDPALAALASRPDERGARPDEDIPGSFLETGLEAAQESRLIGESLAAIQSLSDRLAQVPYQNSVPGALAALERSALDLTAAYGRIVDLASSALTAEARRADGLLPYRAEADQLRAAVESLARANGDAGYVLSAEPGVVYVWLDQLASGASEAWIFRDDKAIARVRLARDGHLWKATILESTEGEAPKPFDKLLVSLDAAAPASGGTK